MRTRNTNSDHSVLTVFLRKPFMMAEMEKTHPHELRGCKNMSKEKIIGVFVLIVAFLILVYYTWGLVLLQLFPTLVDWVNSISPPGTIWNQILNPDPMFLIVLPVWLAAVLVCVIGMWIGLTMITTPAPEPLEDFDFEEPAATETKTEQKPTEEKATKK